MSALMNIRTDKNGKSQVFDPLRKRWVAYTPEESVRQHFVAYLINTLGYPAGRIGNEVSLELNGTPRRCDTLVYANDGSPLMLIEYKASEVPVNRKVFEQVLRYALVLHTPWIVVSNGLKHFCARAVEGEPPKLHFMEKIPPYSQLLSL